MTGRPPKNPSTLRIRRINVNIPDNMLKHVKERAGRQGVSGYLHELVVNDLNETTVFDAPPRDWGAGSNRVYVNVTNEEYRQIETTSRKLITVPEYVRRLVK